MDLSNLTQTEYADIFADKSQESSNKTSTTFSSQEVNADLFKSTTDTTTEKPVEVSTTDTTTQLEEADLLGGDQNADDKSNEKQGAGRPPKYDFSDMSGYVEDRVKKGFFAPIEIEDEQGEKKLFVPKTPEEFDEVFELQINHKLEEAKKDIDKTWYAEKSPVWQAVAKYAETVNNPVELMPFLQGVKNIQTVANIDETQIEGAEQIVRLQLESTGQPKALIETQIEALKTTNKILDAAKALKPEMIQAEQKNLVLLEKQKKQDFENYRNMVIDIRDNAIKAIETPIGKEKLKQDEKAAIYELIAEPNPETKGYAIFDRIDELFEKKDFEKLKKLALLIENEEAFTKYVSSGIADKTAEALQKKLRITTERANSKTQDSPDNKTVIQRNTYKKPGGLFGRG